MGIIYVLLVSQRIIDIKLRSLCWPRQIRIVVRLTTVGFYAGFILCNYVYIILTVQTS